MNSARHGAVLDTLMGTVIGMVLSVVFSSLDDRALLARHHSERLGG